MKTLFYSKTVTIFIFFFVVLLQSCSKVDDVTTIEKVPPIEDRLSADVDFNLLTEKILTLSTKYVIATSISDKNQATRVKQKLEAFRNQTDMTQIQYQEAGILLGYSDGNDFYVQLSEIVKLKKALMLKYPDAMTNEGIIEKAVQKSYALQNFTSDSNAKTMGNCRGVYKACTTLVAVTGIVGVGLCGPAAPFCAYGAVLIATAAMELCRQEYIGCVQDANH